MVEMCEFEAQTPSCEEPAAEEGERERSKLKKGTTFLVFVRP